MGENLTWRDLEETERDLVRWASAGTAIFPINQSQRTACERLVWYGLMEFISDRYELTPEGYQMFFR